MTRATKLEPISAQIEAMAQEIGIPMSEALSLSVLDFACRLADARSTAETDAEELDPTPWCAGCGAKRQVNCHCGPLAVNE